MKRLTTNKDVSEMRRFELAHNSCYSKDGEARYRNYELDIAARELTKKMYDFYCNEDCEEMCDEEFDDWITEYMQFRLDSLEGLLAAFYTHIWAMADLRERLKEYEDMEEQERLVKLPCKVGDIVYTNISMQGWYFRKNKRPYKAKVVFIGINGVDNFMNVEFENEAMLPFKFSEIGKFVFLTKEEAEAAIKA